VKLAIVALFKEQIASLELLEPSMQLLPPVLFHFALFWVIFLQRFQT
jgi:hypothetical protein